MTFDEYVAGKSVAIVGPAPMLEGQAADIDSHDLVYRPAHAPIGGEHGQRIDIAFLNMNAGRTVYSDDQTAMRSAIEPATWWVYKGSTSMTGRRDGLWRRIVKPKLGMNLNAVTAMLFDLVKFDTGPISVYGADLYAAGPGSAYWAGYDRRDVHGQAQGIITHEPFKQMRVHRRCVATGRVVGDDRYMAAVSMTDEEYQTVIDRWKAVLEETP